MKNIIIILVFIFSTTLTFGQYNKWAVDFEYGNHKVDDESAITVDKSTHFGAGLRYNFNPKVGLGLTAAFDNGILEDFDGFAVDLDYSRVNLEAYLNVFKILDLHSNYFTLIAHGGPGFSKIESGSGYSENIFNIHGGVTGLLKLGNRVALKADFSTTGNISQSKTMDGSFDISNTGINSTLHNVSVGLVFYLGKKKTVHADWYKAEPVVPVIIEKQPIINNYITKPIKQVVKNCDCEYVGHEYMFFEHDKDYVEGIDQLTSLYKIFVVLNENPNYKLKIIGWASATSSTGEYNLALSKRRADNLREKLINMNIDPSRIKASANGKDFDYSTESVHDIGRRIELIVTKNK